ncbi:MAG: response regulator [Proteobacteria bacterium]|nr:response regulator [Pseudomonadota bacterium]
MRFTFSFAAARCAAPSEARIAMRPLTVLIIEDTTLVRRLMTRLLTLDGHAVIEVETLGQGFEQAGRHKLDLVLLDLHLPDGDGLSLIEQWPGDHERPAVIVLTAAVARDTEERVMSAGAIVLRKPIAAADLRVAIARACGGPAPPKAANGFDDEMAKLVRDAREEITKRAAELADLVRSDGPRTDIQQRAHKLAGLAAQFYAPRIAEIADRIEQACKLEGILPRDCLADLEFLSHKETDTVVGMRSNG